ncbi:MAG: Gfo/Idh/MocA family protein [Candidatus Zipacnadales bacterium]
MKELGICVLGAGDMGHAHLAAWNKVCGTRLVALADIDEQRRQAAAEKHGVAAVFADIQEAITQDGVDIVSVCLPTYLHRAASEAAMHAGRDVLCEKPIALTLTDAEAMIACRDQTRRKLGIAFCKRHLPQLTKLRELVQEGAIGRPVMYRMIDGLEIRFKPWIMARDMGGGPLVDLCCHYFDQWCWIFGAEPVRVMAMGMTFARGVEELPDIDVQTDTATLCVEYSSGDIGVISLTWGLPRGTSAPGPEQVLGPKGIINVQGFKSLQMFRKGGQSEFFGEFAVDLYDKQAAAFAEVVRSDSLPLTGAEEGLMALRVSLAALESIETGQAVEIATPCCGT